MCAPSGGCRALGVHVANLSWMKKRRSDLRPVEASIGSMLDS